MNQVEKDVSRVLSVMPSSLPSITELGRWKGTLSSEGVFLSHRVIHKSLDLCKMLEKKINFCCLPTLEEKQSPVKTLGNRVSDGEKVCSPTSLLVVRRKRAAFTLGSGLFCAMDGCLTPISPLKHRSHCVLRLIFIFSLPYLFLDRVLVCSSGLHRTDRYRPTSTFQVLGGLCPTTANLGLGFLNHVSR